MHYSPEFTGPIEGWVVNGMKANYFRVERTLSREEYLHEAYVVFLRVKNKYEGKVEEPQHFMALFKRAWTNELNDLATKDTQQRMFVAMPTMRSDDGDESDVEVVGELDNDGALATLLRQAPREVAMVLNLFLAAPQEVAELALQRWRGKKDRRYAHGGSGHICKLLGLPQDLDVMQSVEDYFRVH